MKGRRITLVGIIGAIYINEELKKAKEFCEEKGYTIEADNFFEYDAKHGWVTCQELSGEGEVIRERRFKV